MLSDFERVAKIEFGCLENFQCRHATLQDQDSCVVQFHALDWDIELFCQRIPTKEQWGVRHFNVEKRILTIEPALRKTVRRLKEDGLKAEPAFAAALGLSGDPYAAVLKLEALSNVELREVIKNRPS